MNVILLEIAYSELPLFASMTFPMFRPAMNNCHPSVVAVGVTVGEQPVGLALAAQRTEDEAELLSVFVQPDLRRIGLGNELLKGLEAAVKARGCRKLKAVYTADVSRADGVGALLLGNGWTEPARRTLVCRAGRKLLNAPWVERYRLRQNFEVVPWTDVTPEELEDLNRRRDQIPPTLIPSAWQHEPYPLEPLNSIAIRQQQTLMGWLLTHRVAPDTIRYSCAYVNTNLQPLAIGA